MLIKTHILDIATNEPYCDRKIGTSGYEGDRLYGSLVYHRITYMAVELRAQAIAPPNHAQPHIRIEPPSPSRGVMHSYSERRILCSDETYRIHCGLARKQLNRQLTQALLEL